MPQALKTHCLIHNEKREILPTPNMDKTEGIPCLGHSNWTMCSPLSHFCSKIFTNFSFRQGSPFPIFPRLKGNCITILFSFSVLRALEYCSSCGETCYFRPPRHFPNWRGCHSHRLPSPFCCKAVSSARSISPCTS